MEEYIDILIERVRIIKNWKEYMPMIAKVIKKIFYKIHKFIYLEV